MKKTKLLGHSINDSGQVVFRLDRLVLMKINYSFLMDEGEYMQGFLIDYFAQLHMKNKLTTRKKQIVHCLLKYRKELTEYIDYVWFSLWDRRMEDNYLGIRFGRQENGWFYMYTEIYNPAGDFYEEQFLIDWDLSTRYIDFLIYEYIKVNPLQKASLYHLLKSPQRFIQAYRESRPWNQNKKGIPFQNTCLMYRDEYN